jgi:hypothetical protein
VRGGREWPRVEYHPNLGDLAVFDMAPLGDGRRRGDARVEVVPGDHVGSVDESFVHDDIGLYLRQAADRLLIRVGGIEVVDRSSEIDTSA